jgi:hypothetical protein
MDFLLTLSSNTWVRLVCLIRGHAMRHRATYYFGCTTVTAEQCTRCGHQTSVHVTRKDAVDA